MTQLRKERKPRRPKRPFIGKSAGICFPTSTAELIYRRDGRMEWRVTDSEGRVITGVESVTYLQIDDHTHMLTWIEKTGFAVTQIVDNHMGLVKAFWSRPLSCGCCRTMSDVVHGTFQFVEDGWEGGSLPPKGVSCTPSKS